MPKFHDRGAIVAVFLIALSWSKAADAQFYAEQPVRRGGLVNNLATGVQYDIENQRLAEHRLHHLQAKLRYHVEHGNPAAADRDMSLIHNVKHRIAVDEWLIRKNLLLDPGCYPHVRRLDAMSCAVIGQYHRP